MTLDPKRAAMTVFMVLAFATFIFVSLATRIGREMFVLLSAVLIFGMAILLVIWGVTRFLRRREKKDLEGMSEK